MIALTIPGMVASGTATSPGGISRPDPRVVATAPGPTHPAAPVSAAPLVLPSIPTRASVREQIERIDPGEWLQRYGEVERRELR